MADFDLIAELSAPPALRCPGCDLGMTPHADHARCEECGACWQDGVSKKPVLHS